MTKIVVEFDLKSYLYLSSLTDDEMSRVIKKSYLRIGDDEFALDPCGWQRAEAAESRVKALEAECDEQAERRISAEGDRSRLALELDDVRRECDALEAERVNLGVLILKMQHDDAQRARDIQQLEAERDNERRIALELAMKLEQAQKALNVMLDYQSNKTPTPFEHDCLWCNNCYNKMIAHAKKAAQS